MGNPLFTTTLEALMAQAAAFQALLLAASAVHKAVRWRYSVHVVRQFAGVPAPLAASALGIAVAAEGAWSVLLVLPGGRWLGALLAASLWVVYLVLIVRAFGREVDCGCSFGSSAHPVGRFEAVRNGVLAGLSLLVAAVSATAGAIPVEGSQWLGGLALLVLYGALEQVMSVKPLRRGELL
jgi:hypothetical protein